MSQSFNKTMSSVWVGLLFVVLVTAGAEQSEARTILVMGDSLSDAYRLPKEVGWVYQLQQALEPDTSVVNASISGETSAGGALRLPSLLETHEPDVVMIILGGNDGLRALHPNQLMGYLSQMIELSLDAGARVGLMQIHLPPNLGPVYTERFEAVYPELANRYDVMLVPFFLVDFFQEEGMIMDDGIHPTAKAQPLMYQSIRPYIDQLLAGHPVAE